MSSSSRYLGNALFNLLGAGAPALVTIFTIPYIVTRLGDGAYGVLTLVTSIMGYFALLDVNVTAGSVKFVAEHHARGDTARVHQTVTFGLWVYLGIGVAGLLGILASGELLIARLFNIPAELHDEALSALHWAALGFLFGQLQVYLQSVPQALQRFDVSGRIEAAFGVTVPLLTVALLAAGHGLVEVVILRVAASVVHCAALLVGIARLLPGFRLVRPEAAVRAGILSFSAYSFLSRLAHVTHAHADKLIIGALIGVQQVTYFAVASTLANRVLSLTARLSGVIFPVASALAASREMQQLERLYLLASRYLFFINGAAVVILACFAEPILRLWMGPGFARHGAVIMAVVAVAQFIDALTNIPSLVNDGLGHPRVSGLFATARAALGLALLYVGVLWWQGEGAAWAHLVASAVMTAAFVLFVHERTVPIALRALLRHAYVPPLLVLAAAAAAAAALPAAWTASPWGLALTVLVASLILAGAGWPAVLSADHRSALLGWLQHRLSRPSRA